jgi:hypothetical protein
MKSNSYFAVAVLALILAVASGAAYGSDMDGTVKLGGVIIDDEGNPGVNQSTFNTYEGVALSLEKFRYNFDNGARLYADLKNITMNNRRLRVSLKQVGRYGVSFNNSQYRRLYSQDGSRFTRRRQTGGEAWVQPVDFARLYGGYNRTDRYGDQVALFSDLGAPRVYEVNYTNTAVHGGLTLEKDRRQLDVNYRTTSYTDELGVAGDRSGNRFRTTLRSPLPRFDNVVVYGGFQNYRYKVDESSDTLTANTGWFGGLASLRQGFSLRGNFIWDRARRTGDLSASDNLATAFYLGKTWVQQGGLTVGYTHYINDDVRDELSGDGYHIAGWYAFNPRLMLKAGYGSEQTEVNAGRTLVGNEDKTSEYASIRYQFRPGSQARISIANRSRENDEIGSSADYFRFGADLFYVDKKYGELSLAYSYLDGEYEYSDGQFAFRDHVISGDVSLPEYERVTLSGGGSYVRSLEDIDIESFSVRVSASFDLNGTQSVEFTYTAHNFDDLSNLKTPPYVRYYTANIVEINLVSGL